MTKRHSQRFRERRKRLLANRTRRAEAREQTLAYLERQQAVALFVTDDQFREVGDKPLTAFEREAWWRGYRAAAAAFDDVRYDPDTDSFELRENGADAEAMIRVAIRMPTPEIDSAGGLLPASAAGSEPSDEVFEGALDICMEALAPGYIEAVRRRSGNDFPRLIAEGAKLVPDENHREPLPPAFRQAFEDFKPIVLAELCDDV